MPEDDPTTDPVSRGGTSTVRSDGAQLQPGHRIGHYKILEQIGEGGFAIVYLAEQEKPVRRRVAPVRGESTLCQDRKVGIMRHENCLVLQQKSSSRRARGGLLIATAIWCAFYGAMPSTVWAQDAAAPELPAELQPLDIVRPALPEDAAAVVADLEGRIEGLDGALPLAPLLGLAEGLGGWLGLPAG